MLSTSTGSYPVQGTVLYGTRLLIWPWCHMASRLCSPTAFVLASLYAQVVAAFAPFIPQLSRTGLYGVHRNELHASLGDVFDARADVDCNDDGNVDVFEFGNGGMDVSDLLSALGDCEEDLGMLADYLADHDDQRSSLHDAVPVVLDDDDWEKPPRALDLVGDVADAVEEVEEHGVVRVCAISPQVAEELRREVLSQLEHARGAEASEARRSGEEGEVFSSVLAPDDGLETPAEVRWDLRLRLTKPVTTALSEMFAPDESSGNGGSDDAVNAVHNGSVGRLMEQLVGGGGAELWELAALVSAPGALAQAVHSDTLYSATPCLFTAFVALQPVTSENGPTRFVPRTHTAEAQAARPEAEERAFLASRDTCLGILSAGEAAIYDGRLRHCGSANRGDSLRVLFYVTLRHALDDDETLSARANEAAHSIRKEYAGRLRLEDLMCGRANELEV